VDVNTLRQQLGHFENRDAGTLTLPLESVDPTWTAIRALLQNVLAAQTLAVTAIGTWPPDVVSDQVVYSGQSRLFTGAQASLSVTATFTVDAFGAPQLRLEAVAPTGWTADQSLSGLAGTTLASVGWDDAAFLLTSVEVTDARYPKPVAPWVNLSGTVSVDAGPFARAGALLTGPASRTVAGHVDLSQGSMPVMTLAPALTGHGNVGDLGLELGAELDTRYVIPAPDPDEPIVPPPWAAVQAAVVAYLSVGTRPVRLVMPVLPDGGTLAMSMDSEPVPLSGLADLAPVVGHADLDIIPAEVPSATGFVLKGLSMAVDPGSPTGQPARAAASVDVALRTGGWAILPAGILSVNELGLQARVDFDLAGGPTVAGALYGQVTLVGIELDASVSIPGLLVQISLTEGFEVRVADVLKHFMEGLTNRPFSPPDPDMTIVTLDVAVEARTGRFEIATEVATGWNVDLGKIGGKPLVSLGMESVSLFVEYDGSVLGGSIEAVTRIGSTRLWVAASTAGGADAGWDLGAGLLPNQSIDVIGLIRGFMFPDPAAPEPGERYGVPTLKVTALDLGVSLDPDRTPFHYRVAGSVEASWSFKVFDAQQEELKLTASAELNGSRALVNHRVPPGTPWVTNGKVSGTVTLFGLLLSASYKFSETNEALTFGVWWGQRGLEATVSREIVTKDGKKVTKTLLTIRFGDLSLGEILEYLVGLAVPGESRRLPSPWDLLYQVNFRDLSLKVDLDTYDVEVEYPVGLKLGFASITTIGLLYTTAGGEGQVLLKLTGDFLGQPYGTDGKSEPVTWDVVGEPAPAIPGKGSTLVDIRYVSLGQRVALPVPDSQLKTVEQTLTAMRDAMKPVPASGNPLDRPGTAGLRYDAGTGWLFGVDATLLETLTLSIVFYDPHLYGALIELKGERAGALAGLRFELVYRRITADIGELSVDLRVPDAFRNWEFGEVSVTLGLIHVDIYTNGNFRVDAGFPTGGDFGRSFSVQVFPFIGQGGLYLAVLTGATSERVPKISNGTFDPVIEAGVGLAVGIGKEFKKGPLSAGLALEVTVILEGVYAPFHAYDASLPKDTYYWFQGTAGIVGKLYGEVDFYVVKASVNIEARAQAVLTIEAHRPTEVELTLSVTARASITVLFVTVKFSFDLDLDASFSFGSASPTPWVLAPTPTPELRQQRSQARPRARLRAPRFRPALAAPSAIPPPWQPVALYAPAPPKTLKLQFVPALTVAQPPAGGDNQVEIVLLLGAENAIDPHARTADEVRHVTTGHLHDPADDGAPAFAPAVETVLRWAAKEGASASGADRVLASQLAEIVDYLHDPGFVTATFAYSNLTELLKQSLHLEIRGCPSAPTPPSSTSATFFPMVPAITAIVTQGTTRTVRDYTTTSTAGDRYTTNLAAYFERLATDALTDVARDPLKPSTQAPEALAEAVAGDDPDPSLDELIFGECFALLTRATVQAAVDLLAAFPVDYPGASTPGPSLRRLAQRFAPSLVTVAVARGQTLEGLAAETGADLATLAALHSEGLPDDSDTVEVPIGVTPLSVAEDNQQAGLAAVSFNATGLHYQVRAAQTLNQVAAALPQQTTAAAPPILGPLTGAAVATANANRVGLLREGATLTIPPFTYQRLPGDTDAFLQAFFQVRNGTAGKVTDLKRADLDWWAQAIATLNPDPPIDWSKWGTATIVVPTAPHDTTNTAVYTIHQGDTLERVATTLAIASSGVPPTSGTYPVPKLDHPIVSTDRFTTLVVDFPGLTQDALIAANVDADVLTPLELVELPGFGVSVTAGQTLAGLATVFDLTLAELVELVAGTPGIFQATTPDKPLVVRDVPSATVDDLVTAIAAKEPGNEVAAQVSRFLLHGLRVPSPQDTTFTSLTPQQVRDGTFAGTLYGAYDAAGLQFPWSDWATQPIGIELSTSVDWVTLRAPALTEGRVVGGEERQSISVTLRSDAPPFDGWLPSTDLALDTTAAALPLAATRPRHFDLPGTIHWQAAEPPTLGGGDDGQSPGEPSIWPFTASLRAAARAGAPATPTFALRAAALDAPPGTEGADLTGWAWAVHVDVAVRRVPAPPAPGDTEAPGWLQQTYVVDGADPAGQDVLYGLWVHLARNAATEAGTKLYLLRPPSAASATPRGVASDPLGTGGAYLLKANLSTETRAPSSAFAGTDDPPPPETFSAGLGDPQGFVTFLWEASTVQAGGFFLHYATAGGAGLPDYIFDGSGRATLTLVCLLKSQAGGTPTGLLPFNTCAVVTGNVDAAATHVYAVQTGGTPPVTTAATVPPGNVGFTLSRTSPEPAPGTLPTPAQRTQLLYNLFGFAVAAGGGFDASNQGLPTGPTGGDATTWTYEQVLNAAALATDAGLPQHCAALPSAEGDPYAGVSSSAAVTVALTAQDAFGNRAQASDRPSVPPLPVRYTDPLVALGEWAGAISFYTVAPPQGGGAPQLQIALALQTATFLPAPGVETAVALPAASAFALRYERVLRQLARPGVTVSATTSLDPASATSPLPLSVARFAGFAIGAYVLTSQLAGLSPVRHVTAAGETLATVVSAYSVTAADLFAANAELDAGALFAGPVVVPTFDRVKQRETINDFAQRNHVDATTLLSSYDNGSTLVAAGTSLAVASHTLAVDATLTLAETAAAAGCDLAALATANAATANLLVKGSVWLVRGTQVAASGVPSAPGATFETLVADFAAAGVTTTPAEIATANAHRPGVLYAMTPATQLTVDHVSVAAPITITALAAAHYTGVSDFVAKNGGLPGVVQQGTTLQTGLITRTAPAGVRLREFAERVLVISIAQLARANAAQATGGPAIPPLGPNVKLLLPALLDPTALAATPLAVASGQSLNDVATELGMQAGPLGTSIQDIRGVFVPGVAITVGSRPAVTAGAEDSLASLLTRFPAANRPSLDDLIAAIAPTAGILRPGAVLVGPPPTVPSTATTLTGFAAALHVADVVALGRCNAALDGFLDPEKTLTFGGSPTTVGPHGTLTSLYRRAVPGGDPGFDSFLTAIAGADLLKVRARTLLPAPGVSVAADLPAEAAVATTITALDTAITIARPAGEVASEFGPDSVVATSASPVAAKTAGNPATYDAFAQSLQDAWGGQLRVAAGKPSDDDAPGRSRLYVTRFEAPEAPTTTNAIRRVAVGGTPSFFALPPLCRELVSRPASVRPYVSAADSPWGPAKEVAFKSIDVQGWAASALAAVDLVLSAPYAAGAYAVTQAQGTSTPFDRIVGAKRTLSQKVAAGLSPVLKGTAGDQAAAAATLRQTLDVSLSQGWDVAAVAQVPTQVSASFAASGLDAGGHRLAAKAAMPSTTLSAATTLSALATAFSVHVATVTDVLGSTPNLLQEGVTLRAGGRAWTIGANDTLQYGADQLHLDLPAFAETFKATAPLFRDGVGVTLTRAAASVGAGDALESMADQLAAGVGAVGIANQAVDGLLTGKVYVDDTGYDVTPETSSIAGMAAARDLTPGELAVELADQVVLVPGKTLHMLAVPPELTISAGKVGLDAGATGSLALLLSLADPGRWRRLVVDLELKPIGLEYAVVAAPLTDGYEDSDWLTFVTALSGAGSGQPADIETDLGQLEIPVPLRAYPVPPRLVAQSAAPSRPVPEPGSPPAGALDEAKRWTYTATFEAQTAAQDTVWLKVGFNFGSGPHPSDATLGTDPFAALAELMTNLDTIQADLRELLLPPADLSGNEQARKRARSAVVALADVAEKIAGTWGPVAPHAPAGLGDSAVLAPEQELTFTLEPRTRPERDGTPVIDRLVLGRGAGTTSWGPHGTEPRVGYVDDEGKLELLEPQAHDPQADQLVYVPDPDRPVTAFARRVFAIAYPDLDALVTQNARAAVWLTRNERLVPDRVTEDAFVYRTPEARFADICVPALVRDQPIEFGAGTIDQLSGALTTLFDDLLGTDPTQALVRLKLTLRQGYRLVPADEPGGEGIEMLSPVAFRPLFDYDVGVPGEIVKALKAAAPLAPGTATLACLEVMAFSKLIPERQQPLVDLLRLDYVLTSDSSSQAVGG
jgi:LysM repeat protein